jgi:sterol desaturase/sphingolipid hydroxylase (fatty acid hydroxylase superfamily)
VALGSLFSVAIFPLVLGGAVAWSIARLRAGVEPSAAIAVPTLCAALLVLVAERIRPRFRSWQRSHGGVSADLAHLVSVTLTAGLAQVGVLALALPLSARLTEAAGSALWPVGWPWLAQLPLALVVAELPKYWAHRLEHTTDLLWRIHATHHSAPRLYWLNAARFHPLDIGLDAVVGLTPLVLLGAGPELLALFALVSAVHGYFQHANLELRLGPLNYFFSMAELHRWHHSKRLDEANHNYGQNLIVWDLVFGTFFWPEREPPEEIGLPDLPGFPTRFWAQLASPFRWRRILGAGAGGYPPGR